MSQLKRVGLCAAVAVCGAAVSVDAQQIPLIVFENDTGGDTTGLNLSVELIDGGTHVDFKFRNDSSIFSTVSAVYVEGTVFAVDALVNGAIAAQSTGVSFGVGAAPPNPPGSIAGWGGAWAGNVFSADANPPPAVNGIDPTEYLTIRFEYGGGATFGDVVAAMMDPDAGMRVAAHVISVGDDEFSLWVVSVPAPGSAAAMALAGLAVARRRRR